MNNKNIANQPFLEGFNSPYNMISYCPPPSAIKWSGGKRTSALAISKLLPSSKRYYEPFIGGGSVLYCRTESHSIASDIYEPLIDFWKLVKNDAYGLISDYRNQWTMLQDDLPGYFYSVRDRFNQNPNGYDLSFLSRTCVNGIIRFNSDGKFNNSFHLSRRGMQPERFERAILQWTKRLRTVDFRCCDYMECVRDAQKGDLVYMDPPYLGSKQRYIADLRLDDLLSTLESLNRRGVRWALSFDGMRGNSDYRFAMPKELFVTEIDVGTGLSAVKKVLSGASEEVTEKLYLNF